MSLLSTHRLSEILLFVLDQREVIAAAVPAFRIVEHLDIEKNTLLYLSTGVTRFSWNSFALEKLEELLATLALWKFPR